jgi:hypothetical protein
MTYNLNFNLTTIHSSKGTVVMGMPHHDFEEGMAQLKKDVGAEMDGDLTVADLTVLVSNYKEIFTKHGRVFLTDPTEQLHAAVFAVFDSWHCDRAIKYREAEGITGLLGTAVSVQVDSPSSIQFSPLSGYLFTFCEQSRACSVRFRLISPLLYSFCIFPPFSGSTRFAIVPQLLFKRSATILQSHCNRSAIASQSHC